MSMSQKMQTEKGCTWQLPPSTLALGGECIHVWRAPLDLPLARLTHLYTLLSADEWKRASRFHFRQDRDRFVAARGMLRIILARYLKIAPEQVCFQYNDFGKPFLASDTARNSLCFNVSHSNGLALYAMTLNREIGVDLEYIRPDFANMQIAERFFSPSELVALYSLSAQARVEGFFNCWTRKEAYIKGKGEGLSIPLDQFDVSLAPGEPTRLLVTRNDPLEAKRWSLQALSPGEGYAAAVAVKGHSWHLDYWQGTMQM